MRWEEIFGQNECVPDGIYGAAIERDERRKIGRKEGRREGR